MWHIFENFDGSFTAYYDEYEGSFGAAAMTAVFCVILAFLGVACWPYLTIPVLSLGLGFGIPAICSRGMEGDVFTPVITLPLTVFGWAATCWVVMATYETAGTGPAALMGYILLAIIGIVGVFMPLLEWVDDEGVSMFALLGVFGAMTVLWFTAGAGGLGAVSDEGAAKSFLYCFRVLYIYSGIYLAMGAFVALLGIFGNEDEQRRVLHNGALLLAGFAPLIVSSFLSGAGALVATIAALVAYAAIGLVAAIMDAKGAQWALLPLLLFGSASLAAQVQTTYLPPDATMLGLMELCRSNALVQFFASGAAPIIQGFVSILTTVLNAVLGMIAGAFDLEPVYFEMASILSLYVGMGAAAVSLGLGTLLRGSVAK